MLRLRCELRSLHSPPFINFLIMKTNTGRTAIFEEKKKCGTLSGCAVSYKEMQKMQC